MHSLRRTGIIMGTLLASSLLAAPPATKKEAVTDTYHGETVADPYRWLEDSKNPDVQAWSEAQNKHARAHLDKLPGVETIRGRVKDLLEARTITHFRLESRGGRLFAMKRQPPKQQPFLVVMPGPNQPQEAKVLVDPNVLDAKGTTAIDWYVPSPDGKLVAVSLSKAGSEAGDLHIYDVASGKQVHEVIPRVQNGTAGGDLAWAGDGEGFFYTRYPRGKEHLPEDMDFYQQLYFHRLGTPTEQDRYELGKDFPRIAEIRLFTPVVLIQGGDLLVSVQNGDGGEFAHYLRGRDGHYKQFATFKDRVVQVMFHPCGQVLVVSRDNAPRGKVLLLGDDLNLKKAEVLIPEGDATIVTDFYGKPTIVGSHSQLFVTYQLGGPSEVRAFSLNGETAPKPTQPPVASVTELTARGSRDVLIGIESFVEPFGQYLFSEDDGQMTRSPLTTDPSVNFKDVEVRREFATSKDGTKVPVNIMIPKGAKLDGTDPCLATGYGGYGINITPRFSSARRVLFDRGVISVVVNLRGGGEFGEAWHDAGRLTRKQNVFDDFAAALQYLADKKYTSPQRLVIEGGSNGGLLVGATLVQHPDLMKAVVSHVGIYDMLRVELSPNGAFNVPEFGTVKDEAQYKALRAYSPYHNLKDGAMYPAVLLLTGANDPRVDPMQSRKFTARLQAATGGDAPILLRTSASSGHGLDTSLSERIEELTDVYAFIFAQLGVKVGER